MDYLKNNLNESKRRQAYIYKHPPPLNHNVK